MAKTLYICYFGLSEPLVQTQVLPYLREIRKDDIEVSILTFEPDLRSRWTSDRIAYERAELAAEGIDWHCLEYHKWPSVPATFYDILKGTLFIRRFIAKYKPDILHGRVHVPTLMGALARKLSRHKPKLLFDIRGFFPEEYTDAGVWPEGGWLYRSAKRVERWLVKEADGFVVLTEKARQILFPNAIPQPDGGWLTESRNGNETNDACSKVRVPRSCRRPLEVIPCCVDLDKFESAIEISARAIRDDLGIGDRRVIVYVGSFGGWYLTDKMLDFFAAAREDDRNTFALVMTQRDKDRIRDELLSRGFAETEFFVETVAPAEIGRYLSSADIAISFIKACYSKQSSSPTKIAEYLACGVPIIANRGVGDVDDLISRNRVGALIDDFSDAGYRNALDMVDALGDVRGRCRETAEREFSLTSVGGVKYRALYYRLLTGD